MTSTQIDRNEPQEVVLEISPMDKLLQAQQRKLDTIAGNEAIKNFAKALKIIVRTEEMQQIGEKCFGEYRDRFEIGNEIVKMFQKIDELAKEGENDKALEEFDKRSAEIVETGLQSGEITVSKSLKILGPIKTMDLMFKLMPEAQEITRIAHDLGMKHINSTLLSLFNSNERTRESDKKQFARNLDTLIKDPKKAIRYGREAAEQNNAKVDTDAYAYQYFMEEIANGVAAISNALDEAQEMYKEYI